MKEFALINKPVGWTSYDVIGYMKKVIRKFPELKKIKIGHAGTLDPFASGLLIVAIGREATREIDNFKNLPKTYEAEIELGATSNTEDSTGEIIRVPISKTPEEFYIKEVFRNLHGKQRQLPPMFSAKKLNGTRLYKLARQGKEVERKESEIEIFSLELISYSFPFIKFKVTCSAGTYIRTLAKTIGEKMETGAYCKELKRTFIGNYSLTNAIDVKDWAPEVDLSKNL